MSELISISNKCRNLHQLVKYHKENELDRNDMIPYDMYIYEIIFLNFNIEINDLIENYDYKYIFQKILRTYSIYDYLSLVGGYENIKNRLLPVVNINTGSKNLCKIIKCMNPDLDFTYIKKIIIKNEKTTSCVSVMDKNPFKNISDKNRNILKKFFINDYKIIEKMRDDGILIE